CAGGAPDKTSGAPPLSTEEEVRMSWSIPGSRRRPIRYLLPGLILMSGTILVPVVVSVITAFTNYSLVHLDDWSFVGLRNFERVLLGSRRAEFFSVFSWTLTWAVLSTTLSFTLGLGLALLLNRKDIRERHVYRTLLILPWALPSTLTILTRSE